MKPLITIAVPVYNVESYIKDAIVSLLSQTYESIEILIIDDCGIDNSMNIVNYIKQNYNGRKTIRIIKHEENKGLSEARNTAIRMAQGEYIYFIDSDDFIDYNCIQKMYEVMEKEQVDFVIASFKTISEQKSSPNFDLILDDEVIKTPDSLTEYVFQNPDKRFNGFAWNKLFKLSFLKVHHLSFVPNIYYEDMIFSMFAYTAGNSCAFLSDITYYYRQRNNSITHIGKGAFIEKEIKDMSYMYKMEKNYLKGLTNIKGYDNMILFFSRNCYYNATSYIRHNDNHIEIKPYIKDLLYYPLPLWKVLTLKHSKLKHLYLWTLNKLPYFILKMKLLH